METEMMQTLLEKLLEEILERIQKQDERINGYREKDRNGEYTVHTDLISYDCGKYALYDILQKNECDLYFLKGFVEQMLTNFEK